jgi:lactocepin
VKKSRLGTLLLGLSLVIIIILPACSSGTTSPATPAPTSTPATPAATDPLTLQSIEVSPTGTEIRVKSTGQIEVTASYTNGTKQSITAKCTYTSSDEKVATVNTAGLITAVANGDCKITASYTETGVTKTNSLSVRVYSGFLGNN